MFKKNKEVDFFDLFTESIGYGCDAAGKLLELVKDYSNMEQKIAMIKNIEHQADTHAHKIYTELNKAFITPIEREDILKLNQNIDNVVDIIDRIARYFTIFNIKSMEPNIIPFMEIATKVCECTKKAIAEMKNFKKSENLRKLIIEINDIEEEGDDFYAKCVKELFASNKEHLHIIKWYEIYNHIENFIDTCEDIADTIEDIILKNS